MYHHICVFKDNQKAQRARLSHRHSWRTSFHGRPSAGIWQSWRTSMRPPAPSLPTSTPSLPHCPLSPCHRAHQVHVLPVMNLFYAAMCLPGSGTLESFTPSLMLLLNRDSLLTILGVVHIQILPLACTFLYFRCMTAESGLEFISSNAEAHRALMHLHPCKLMRIEQGERGLPANAAALHNVSAAPSTTPGSLTLTMPDSAASQQKQTGKAEHCKLQQPAADLSTYGHIRQEQVGFGSLAGTCHVSPSQQLTCDSSIS